ncbi:hypothetical protein HDV03_003099 [Kappamyces sp. JEL0829]|nr:hypothetical protein HDV03_003099 [Kappamyces sp. JEL0829]KAJ3342699.1 hypothetical protein HDU91_000501 [Kappamyces sp. JEL0680]
MESHSDPHAKASFIAIRNGSPLAGASEEVLEVENSGSRSRQGSPDADTRAENSVTEAKPRLGQSGSSEDLSLQVLSRLAQALHSEFSTSLPSLDPAETPHSGSAEILVPRSCFVCGSQTTAGSSWYKDKLRPSQYLCKTCYIARQRMLKRNPSTTALLEYEEVRRLKSLGVPTSEILGRTCNQCGAAKTSGDWYKDTPAAAEESERFICQACYQRRNRQRKKLS